jgi:hypothetical protein
LTNRPHRRNHLEPAGERWPRLCVSAVLSADYSSVVGPESAECDGGQRIYRKGRERCIPIPEPERGRSGGYTTDRCKESVHTPRPGDGAVVLCVELQDAERKRHTHKNAIGKIIAAATRMRHPMTALMK